MIKILPEREQIRRGRVAHRWGLWGVVPPGRHRGGLWGVVPPGRHRAGIGRAELESAQRRVRRDRVDKVAADDLCPRDPGLGGVQVLLQQGDAVYRGLVAGRGQVGVELVMTAEQAHAKSLAALVVLADERRSQLPGRGGEFAAAGDRHRARHVESGGAERDKLLDLTHLQLEHPPPVHHPAAMRLQPAEHPAGLVLGMRMPPGVRRRAHPGPVHAARWLVVEIQHRLAEQPLLMRNARRVKRRRDRHEPVRVLVKHMNLHRCLASRARATLVSVCQAAPGSEPSLRVAWLSGRRPSPCRATAQPICRCSRGPVTSLHRSATAPCRRK